MIYGFGTDIAEVERMQHKLERNPDLIQHIFNTTEQAYCKNQKHPYISYTARFAVKEAFLKAFGVTFIGNHALPEIGVINDVHGKPTIELTGKTLKVYTEKKLGKILVSISHTKVYAVASVIIEY
jgi:holo-[acyl-carrier protein] synthase